MPRRIAPHPDGNGTVRRDIAKLRTFQFTTILVFHIARQLFHSFEQPFHPFKSSDSASHFYSANNAREMRATTNANRAAVVFAPFTGCPVCFTNYIVHYDTHFSGGRMRSVATATGHSLRVPTGKSSRAQE